MPRGNPNIKKGAPSLNVEKKNQYTIKKEKVAELALVPATTQLTAGETLINATNRTIDIYNKIAISFKDEDIVKMDNDKKITALQKLSYLFNVTKKTKPSNMSFIKINTTGKSAEELENIMLNMDNEEEEVEQE